MYDNSCNNVLLSSQLKWDAILNGEESGELEQQEQWQPNESFWPELGILETGIERIHLRRASLPAGRSGLWTSNFGSCAKGMTESVAAQRRPSESEVDVESIDAGDSTATTPEFDLPRSRPSALTTRSPEDPVMLQRNDAADGSNRDGMLLDPPPELFSVLPTRLPQRRESLPFNFPDRSRREFWQGQGRRESLPTDCSAITLNVDDFLPELSITSMAPMRNSVALKRDKRTSTAITATATTTPATTLNDSVQSPTSAPFTFSGPIDSVCTDEKENLDCAANYKSVCPLGSYSDTTHFLC